MNTLSDETLGALTLATRISLGVALTAITYLALAPAPMMPSITVWDKLNHFAAFFVLAGLCDYSFPGPSWRKRVFIYLFLYGVALELIQWATEYRTVEYWDILANTVGLLSFLVIRPALANIAILRQLQKEYQP